MKRIGVALYLATLAAAALPSAAHAQGFGLNEIGSCAIGRGFAVTGSPCRDASTIYWNPAAATSVTDGVSLLVGGAAIVLDGQFQADNTGRVDKADVSPAVPPHVFVNWKQSPRLALGLGVYVPYGLTSQWKWDFPGRFQAQRASLSTFYVQPNIAYDVLPSKLSIGGGPVIGWSSVELKQGIDAISATPQLAQAGVIPGTEIGRAQLKGDAVAYGAHVGVFYRPLPTVTLGVRYLTKLTFKYDDADAIFTQSVTGLRIPRVPTAADPSTFFLLDTAVARQFNATGPLVNQKVRTEISHPAQLQVGLGYSGFSNTTISLDGAWVQWSAFKNLDVNFAGQAPDRNLIEDYKDIWSIRTGIEHRFNMGIAGRAGFSYAQTPAPDETVTPLLPDMNRYNISVGAGLPLGSRVTLDAAYLSVQTKGRRGRIIDRGDPPLTAEQLNSGAYSLNANIFSLSLKAQL